MLSIRSFADHPPIASLGVPFDNVTTEETVALVERMVASRLPHYLVTANVDFLAGQVRRAPSWMQRTGTEWVFRLLQELRNLLHRHVKDLWVFGRSIAGQDWELRVRDGQTQIDLSPSECCLLPAKLCAFLIAGRNSHNLAAS